MAFSHPRNVHRIFCALFVIWLKKTSWRNIVNKISKGKQREEHSVIPNKIIIYKQDIEKGLKIRLKTKYYTNFTFSFEPFIIYDHIFSVIFIK